MIRINSITFKTQNRNPASIPTSATPPICAKLKLLMIKSLSLIIASNGMLLKKVYINIGMAIKHNTTLYRKILN